MDISKCIYNLNCNDQDINSHNTSWETGKKFHLIKENVIPQVSFSQYLWFFYHTIYQWKNHAKNFKNYGISLALWKGYESIIGKIHNERFIHWSGNNGQQWTTCVCSGCRRKYQVLTPLWLHVILLCKIIYCLFINLWTTV